MSRVIVTVGVATYQPDHPPGVAGTTVWVVTGEASASPVSVRLATLCGVSTLPAASTDQYSRECAPGAVTVTVVPSVCAPPSRRW